MCNDDISNYNSKINDLGSLTLDTALMSVVNKRT